MFCEGERLAWVVMAASLGQTTQGHDVLWDLGKYSVVMILVLYVNFWVQFFFSLFGLLKLKTKQFLPPKVFQCKAPVIHISCHEGAMLGLEEW